MDDSWNYIEVEPIETRADLLLVAAPSYGNVGPAAARILMEEGNLPLVGVFHNDVFPPAATSWEGVVSGPIQVWGAPMRSGPDGHGGGLLVLNVDVPIPPELLMSFARAVVDWAKLHEVAFVVALEGDPAGDGTPTARVSSAANLPAEDIVQRIDAQRRHGGLVGLAPAFLVHGNRAGVPVVALFATVDAADGDPRAATHLLHALAPLVPSLALATTATEARVGPVAERVAADQAKHQRELRRLAEMTLRGYA